MGVPVVFSCVGEAQQPTTGRFRQSRRRICRAEIRRTEGVEASALGREKRITQDNDYYIMHDLERATPHSAQGSSRCRRVEGPLVCVCVWQSGFVLDLTICAKRYISVPSRGSCDPAE